MANIVITWPKSVTLVEYLYKLADAERNYEVINYRVSRKPTDVAEGDLCYIVYDDWLVGYNVILDVVEKPESDDWRAGWYIVRDPAWHPARLIPMQSFRGFRYLVETESDVA